MTNSKDPDINLFQFWKRLRETEPCEEFEEFPQLTHTAFVSLFRSKHWLLHHPFQSFYYRDQLSQSDREFVFFQVAALQVKVSI